MSSLNDHITIPKSVATQDELDFQFLKDLGVSYIKSMGSDLWTDYNTHDPGITILDLMCYAITDLGNRMRLPMEDLLTPADGKGLRDQFYGPNVILPNRALTANDYRKLFIDIDGVRNCWLKPYERTVYVDCDKQKMSYDPQLIASLPAGYSKQFNLKGLYTLMVDYDVDPDGPSKTEINEKILEVYHANRNLCEDLIEIVDVVNQCICVCAIVDLENDADPDEVHANIRFVINEYLSPSVPFRSLKEMLDEGYTMDQIIDGPVLSHGFIEDKTIEAAKLRREVRLSDIFNVVSKISGVKMVRDMSINKCGDDIKNENWVLCIDEGKKATMCEDSAFSYLKDVIPQNIDETNSDAILEALYEALRTQRDIAGLDNFFDLPVGTYQQTEWYTSVQDDLPDTYGVGQYGLPRGADTARKSKARQLQGYLLFFDQVLASYFSHLGKVKDLLSINGNTTTTYFTQVVDGITNFDTLVSDYDMDNEQLSAELFTSLDDTDYRKNELLDHLIARFAEEFSEYTFLLNDLYGTVSREMIVLSKQRFLNEYVDISSNRGGAFNYYLQDAANLWDTSNVSGAQKRIALLVGMKNYFRRFLATSYVQIYALTTSGGDTMYRWRIRDNSGTIILSATDDYSTPGKAQDELYLAVLRVIETDIDLLDTLLDPTADETVIGNLLIQKSPLGKYSIDVVDPENPVAPNYIIGRQFHYYESVTSLKIAIRHLWKFFREEFSEEGMFLVEHILLRPDVTNTNAPESQFIPVSTSGSCDECGCIDPYSFRLSVVLPGYTQRFGDMDFRNFMEELIREELPAHILPRICWVGWRINTIISDDGDDTNDNPANDLYVFERAYKDFLLTKTNLGQMQDETTLNALKVALFNLNTIYPSGWLTDCDSDDPDKKTILGRTNLGTL